METENQQKVLKYSVKRLANLSHFRMLTTHTYFFVLNDSPEKQGKTIVYVDESGFAKDMPRTHGYCKRGDRCFGTHDWHSKGRVNAMGSINSDVFYA